MADTVVTLNGLLHGVLHLFSRTNSEQIAIRPKDIPWASSRPFRLFGPNDLNIHDFISTPIITDRDVERTMLYTGMEKKVFSGYQNEPALPRQQFISIHPDVPPVSFLPSSMVVKKTASQYSLYPLDKVQSSKIESTHASKPSTSSDSSKSANSDLTLRPPGGSIHTTFSNDSELFNTDLQPPEPLFSVHKTRNSETTSAIVEIALRLSNAPSYADSVYTHKPISPIESLNLKKAPSLISPDKYVSSARLAEAAKSRPINTGETDQTADMSQVHKLMPPTKLIGLPKVPKTNLRESIANLILKRQSSISRSTNKELPPVPGLENPQENAASKALLKSSYSKALAPTQQAILPAPDWR